MIETEDAALMVASESVPSRGSRGWKIAVAISTLMLMSTLPILISHWREEAPQPGPVMRFEVPLPSGVTSFDAPSLAAPFSVSPDGRHIVLGSGATAGGRRYWIHTLASLDTRELQIPSSVSTGLSWSIDSRSLGFVVDGRPKSMDIAAGTTETLSVDGSISPSSVLLGPDGKILMTHAGGISLVAKPGGPSVPLVKNEGAERAEVIQFLPGGRHFLFRVRVPNPERAGIYVESVEAGRPKREPGRLAPSSPTGRHC
jgi:hypothetical protein